MRMRLQMYKMLSRLFPAAAALGKSGLAEKASTPRSGPVDTAISTTPLLGTNKDPTWYLVPFVFPYRYQLRDCGGSDALRRAICWETREIMVTHGRRIQLSAPPGARPGLFLQRQRSPTP